MLEGEVGVGKTALWRRALDVAAASGWRILASAPAGSEAGLAFAALGDLLDLVVDDALPALSGPQRRGLEVALLRGDGGSAQDPIDERTIGVATLSALRLISARAPLVLAIDDLQWVDASSAAALRFALRRLRGEPVLVLATLRLEAGWRPPLELERMLGDERVRRLGVGPPARGQFRARTTTPGSPPRSDRESPDFPQRASKLLAGLLGQSQHLLLALPVRRPIVLEIIRNRRPIARVRFFTHPAPSPTSAARSSLR